MTEHQHDILKACRKGDRLAQRKLYEHFKNKMFVVCLRYANSREDAEDILQDGFIQIFRDLHQYKGIGSFEGWVRKVMVRTALQHLRKQKKLLPVTDLEDHVYSLHEEEPVFEDENEMAKMLLKLMHQMPTGFRTVLNLYVLEGYTHPQIADELGISVGTSKSQLNRAKAFLKTLLEKNLAG